MTLHSSFNPDDTKASPFDVQTQVAKDFTVIPPLPEVRGLLLYHYNYY